MPKVPVTFDVIDSHPEIYHYSICGHNPATPEAPKGPCRLQCVFSLFADLAEWTVDNMQKTG